MRRSSGTREVCADLIEAAIPTPFDEEIAEWQHSIRGNSVEVRVPGSTSNLGAGFDCYALALQIYLTVRATIREDTEEPCRARSRGEGSSGSLPRDGENLVCRAISFVAAQRSVELPPLRLAVLNEIPLGRGLGSSAAAIIAGIKLFAHLFGQEFTDQQVLGYAKELEGHADNVAASLHGGLVVTCVGDDGGVLSVKKHWPPDIKVLVISPHVSLGTAQARAVLPPQVNHTDAVYNLQRAALFGAALDERRDDLLWESMRDRLHQPYRETLVPGLREALSITRRKGLLGISLSGAGPSVLALADDCYDEIQQAIAENFHRHGIETSARLLKVDADGARCRKL